MNRARSSPTGQLSVPPSDPALAMQLLASLLLGFGLPLGVYAALNATGHDTSGPVYALALASVILDMLLAVLAGITILRISRSRRRPDAGYPPASAILLTDPSSAPRAVETSTLALLQTVYRSPVQVVVCPCTSEQEQAIAHFGRLHGHRLDVVQPAGTGAAPQLSAALPAVRGQVVGIFRAGQRPFPDAYLRAWYWLARGYAAVGGGLLLRTTAPRVHRLEAVESAAAGMVPPTVFGPEDAAAGCLEGNIYLPLRLLQRIVAEDRLSGVVPAQRRRSFLATWLAYCRRRLREETDLHETPVSAPRLQAVGAPPRRALDLPVRAALGWHAAYAWLSAQVPIAAVLLIWSHGLHPRSTWLVALLALLLLYVLGTNIVRAVFAYAASPPELARHRPWFVDYALLSAGFYRGLNHTLARAAQLRIMGTGTAAVAPPAGQRDGWSSTLPAGGALSDEDLAGLKTWLLRVATNPYNVEILASIADDAPAFAQIVEAYGRARDGALTSQSESA